MRVLTNILCLLLPISLFSLVGCTSTEEIVRNAVDETTKEHNKEENRKWKLLGPDDPGIWYICRSKDASVPIEVVRTGKDLKSFWKWYGDRPLDSQEFYPSTQKGRNFKCLIIDHQNMVRPSERPLREAQKQKLETERLKKSCLRFGFKDGTKEMSNCMFELYKLEKSSSPKTQTVIQNNTSDNSAVRALLEEQKKQRQLEGSLEMMKRGLELMKPPPPRPQITCRYISHSKTTVCN